MNERLVDTVNQIYSNMHSRRFVPPVQSLMDVDFYKFLMQQFIHRYYPDVEVTFKSIVRDKHIPLWKMINMDELQQSLEYIQSLTMRKTDIYYLRGMDLYGGYLFDENYLTFLRNLKLSGFKITRNDGFIELSFTTRWAEVSLWETIGMAIVSELYYRSLMKNMTEAEVRDLYIVANHRLQSKLVEIKKHPGIRFADFGQRRRNGFLWQKYVIGEANRVLGDQFTGTSNTWMAFHHDLPPIGTNAHELPMVITAITPDNEKRDAQYEVLDKWESIYGEGLRIMLPDTYGSGQFFAGADKRFTSWRGQRQDSGDPIVEGERYMKWLFDHGVDPEKKLTIFSDGLDVPAMISLNDHFTGKHMNAFGWGTLLTNDVRGVIPGNDSMRPFSMACKVVSADGRPCVKLSNDPNKATGPKEEIVKYLQIFGDQHNIGRETIV